MPVGHRNRHIPINARDPVTFVHNDKIVAQTVHLHERDYIDAVLAHERAYSHCIEMNPERTAFVG